MPPHKAGRPPYDDDNNMLAKYFPSRKSPKSMATLPLFLGQGHGITFSAEPGPSILSRLDASRQTDRRLAELLDSHAERDTVIASPQSNGMEAGKNTYTYDAHTYHTKVPPQGIAAVLSHYLPNGGLVLDPFAGSGMTGVAARVVGIDAILGELSPSACFIADRFTAQIDATLFETAILSLLAETQSIREKLYSTTCRECGKITEVLYTVWSYRVACPHCDEVFVLWDSVRKYGNTVREHKILSEFPCPRCDATLKKSRLKRLDAIPVEIGYKCCGSKQREVTHPPDQDDLRLIGDIETGRFAETAFYPTHELPDGDNLNQPKKHGLTSIDKLYTSRNLAAASHLWKQIHRVDDTETAAFLAFTFTSLYKRITRMSEFRFWGGSGNTAHFNVPYIFNEANVFLSFERKARTIRDHLATTATNYRGDCVVLNQSATNQNLLPDKSVDLVFTDPPFGANINYSEMNIIWESWLGRFTSVNDEAIVNKTQGKGLNEYETLMTQSLAECHRVLKDNGRLVLVFMNSSAKVWDRLQAALLHAGFLIQDVDMFDKRHGTFKQFVSLNTPGYDLMIHCRKRTHDSLPIRNAAEEVQHCDVNSSIKAMVKQWTGDFPLWEYQHIGRDAELNARLLYSEWLSVRIHANASTTDFSTFREVLSVAIADQKRRDRQNEG